MKPSHVIPEYSRLSIPEKILKLEKLWDDIALNSKSVPLPQSHKDELLRRHEGYVKNPKAVLTLRELQARVGNKK